MKEETLKMILELARDYLKEEKVSGLDHTLRVQRWCEHIGRREGADLQVLNIAALLHDIGVPLVGRRRHFEEGAKVAGEHLRELGLPKDKVDQIVHAIQAHSRFGGPEPETREAKILYDADILDYIGSIGIVRAVGRGLMDETYTGKVSEAPKLIEKLIKSSEGRFYTEEARRLGERRLQFTKEFLKKLKEELEFR
ncbi:MAG: HD domain-containing protein [Candidatus Geothermarchaeales archaeon]